MANRNFQSQFNYSWEKQPVSLMGNWTITDVGAFATLTDNGITWTAVTMGSAGNDITVALVTGGTAGSEVVTVTGTAISVQIESGVSTRTQVETAVNGSSEATALVGISVVSGGTAATLLAATPLASGDDTDFTKVGATGMTLTQTGTGVFLITLANNFKALLSSSIMLQKASATDIQPQMISNDVSSAKTISFRTIAGATPTNLAANDIIFVHVDLRNE